MSKAEEKPVSEYGEPWKLVDGFVVGSETEDDVAFSDRNAQRLIACVNAMQGIPNPEAVRELVEAATAVDDALSSGNCTATVHQRQRLTWALDALSAPSTGAQQKGE